MTVLNTTTAEADAALVRLEGDPETSDFTVVREWGEINAENADTLFTALNAVSEYDNSPQANKGMADGQQWTAVFVNSKVEAIEGGQGSQRVVTLRQTLTKVTGIADYAALSAVNPRVIRDKKFIHALSFADWKADALSVVLEYKNLTQGSLAVCMNTVTDANLVTEADTHSDDQGWEVIDRKFTKEDDRTGTFLVLLQEPNYNAFDDTKVKQTGLTNKGGWGESKTEEIKGFDIEDLDEAVPTDADADTGYVITSIRSREANGEAQLTKVQTETTDYYDSDNSTDAAGGVTAPVEITEVEAVALRPAAWVFKWFRVSPDTIDTVKVQAKLIANYTGATPQWALVPSGDNFVVDRVVTRRHPDGSADITAYLRISGLTVSADSTDGRYAWVKYGTSIQYRQNKTVPEDDETEPVEYQEYRIHYQRVERLYTNSKARAYIWATHNSSDAGGASNKVPIPGSPAASTVDVTWLDGAGDSGYADVVWGEWKEREHSGTTKYVAWRCTQDYWTKWSNDSNADVTTTAVDEKSAATIQPSGTDIKWVTNLFRVDPDTADVNDPPDESAT
ncbi:MAG: hypothetical protein GY851_00385 [bacterium]|nr:hypothetical protein [bacterium]